jgi:transposase
MAAGEHPDAVIEATYSWYWAADWLKSIGAEVHLSHPLGNNWGHRRVKNDVRDAEDLADLYRLGRLAPAWIAPPGVRELRELVRYRQKLVQFRTSGKQQIHAVLAKEGVAVQMSDLFGADGMDLLDSCKLGVAYRLRVDSLLDLVATLNTEIASVEDEVASHLAGDKGYPRHPADPGGRTGARRRLRRRDRRRDEVLLARSPR